MAVVITAKAYFEAQLPTCVCALLCLYVLTCRKSGAERQLRGAAQLAAAAGPPTTVCHLGAKHPAAAHCWQQLGLGTRVLHRALAHMIKQLWT